MTMPDILIRHCTLRIVRRGGWNWGPDPAGLVRGTIARIGELLERKLPELWPDDEDIEIAAPVRIHVPVRLHELLDKRPDNFNEIGLSDSSLDERLERAIDAAFAPFAAAHSAPPAPSGSDEDRLESHEAIEQTRREAAEQTRREAGLQGRTALQRLLWSWRERDILAATLADFSPQALEAWHRRLLARVGESPSGPISHTPESISHKPERISPTPESITEVVRTITEEAREYVFPTQGRSADRATLIRLRLYVAAEVAAYFEVELHHPALLDALDRVLPLVDPKLEERGASGSPPSMATPPVAAPTHRPWQGEFAVSSALPFLLLGPLSRIGYLDVLAATLEAAGLAQAAPLFAQALAYKVLVPPERGWRRRQADVAAATVFTGQTDPLDASELTDFARQISPYLSPLDAVLRESLIDGHNPDSPLLIHGLGTAAEGGLLLVDAEGIFPIAWTADLDGLMPTLARFGETALLVPLATVDAAPLARLHAAGFRFITDAPPTRHETWRALRQPPDYRFWTNDGTTPEHRLIALASHLAVAEEETATLWQALAVQRPSVPLASEQALDRSLSLAAAAALGTIAWMLWREREPVAPYLAIDRFYDLDARVTVDRDTVRVRLPLGRRSQDLYEHGLLSERPGCPLVGRAPAPIFARMTMSTLPNLALQHLLLRLRPLNRALHAAIQRQTVEAKRLIRPDITPLCVTEDQVLTLLRDMDGLVQGVTLEEPRREMETQGSIPEPPPEPPAEKKTRSGFWPWSKRRGSEKSAEKTTAPEPVESQAQEVPESKPWLAESHPAGELAGLTPEEQAGLAALRSRASALRLSLPLDHLAQALELTQAEEDALLLCAATELDRSYERIYAYILDDLNRRYPCVELLSSLTADSVADRLTRRHALGRFGRLRRTGALQPYGEPPTELRQELRLAPGLFDYLTGGIDDVVGRFRDPAEVAKPASVELPPHVDRQVANRLAEALRTGRISVLSIWGPRQSGHDQVVAWIGASLRKPVRRCLMPQQQPSVPELERVIGEAIQTASALGALLWIQADPLAEPGGESLSQVLAEALTTSQVPVVLTGAYSWRPLRLLETRRYAEIELEAPGYASRKAMWNRALPYLDEEQIDDLAARFRCGGAEINAAARLARTEAELTGTGGDRSSSQQIERACAAVTRKRSHQFATVVKPRRGPKDLILPPSLHGQVLEVARFFQAWPHVAEEWGFGRLLTGGGGGIKALFTGDSGTGKTLAAEVIAGQLDMPLLKVDLARIVSKWVGETEQHLEAAFREAEDSHCVLFFDECDALFGKRGEVQYGVDRYANLEVSFLLQRLEDHYGLVILASNLKDNIDLAFTRRFQVVIHFPKPEPTERRRIWEIAFPKDSPLDPEVDLDGLSRLDMNGAAIVGAACTAGLLAADENSATITKSHVVRAIARQYQREARILTPGELGSYASALKEAR